MEIIKEDYISFETAKLLKEKGFNEPCIWLYSKEGEKHYASDYRSPWPNSGIAVDEWSCCTHAMAMKWLREKHMLHIWIGHNNKKGLSWYYEIHNIKIGMVAKIGGVDCGSYETACEAAIKYCLENLI